MRVGPPGWILVREIRRNGTGAVSIVGVRPRAGEASRYVLGQGRLGSLGCPSRGQCPLGGAAESPGRDSGRRMGQKKVPNKPLQGGDPVTTMRRRGPCKTIGNRLVVIPMVPRGVRERSPAEIYPSCRDLSVLPRFEGSASESDPSARDPAYPAGEPRWRLVRVRAMELAFALRMTRVGFREDDVSPGQAGRPYVELSPGLR